MVQSLELHTLQSQNRYGLVTVANTFLQALTLVLDGAR